MIVLVPVGPRRSVIAAGAQPHVRDRSARFGGHWRRTVLSDRVCLVRRVASGLGVDRPAMVMLVALEAGRQAGGDCERHDGVRAHKYQRPPET